MGESWVTNLLAVDLMKCIYKKKKKKKGIEQVTCWVTTKLSKVACTHVHVSWAPDSTWNGPTGPVSIFVNKISQSWPATFLSHSLSSRMSHLFVPQSVHVECLISMSLSIVQRKSSRSQNLIWHQSSLCCWRATCSESFFFRISLNLFEAPPPPPSLSLSLSLSLALPISLTPSTFFQQKVSTQEKRIQVQ